MTWSMQKEKQTSQGFIHPLPMHVQMVCELGREGETVITLSVLLGLGKVRIGC